MNLLSAFVAIKTIYTSNDCVILSLYWLAELNMFRLRDKIIIRWFLSSHRTANELFACTCYNNNNYNNSNLYSTTNFHCEGQKHGTAIIMFEYISVHY